MYARNVCRWDLYLLTRGNPANSFSWSASQDRGLSIDYFGNAVTCRWKDTGQKKKKRQEPPPRNNPFSSPQSLSFVDSNEEQAIGEGSTAFTPRKELHLQTKNPIFFGWQTAQKGFLLRNGVLGQKTEWTRPTVLKIRHIWTPQNEPHKFTVRDDT